MYSKLLKIVERIFKVTGLGNLFARNAEVFVGDSKELLEGAREILESIHKKQEVSCVADKKENVKRFNLQIVIPMHNASKYVEHCLESVLSQKTKYSYEVVLVDDGSVDNTYEIAEKYLLDGRVILRKQKNAGAAAARNAGMQELNADYLMFLDIDDALKTGALEILLDNAYRERAEIVEGGYEIFDTKTLGTVCHKNEILTEACGSLWGFPWGKVIDSTLFQEILFPQGYWYEDTIMSYLIYTRSKKTMTINEVVYCYRKNPRGFSHIKGRNPKIIDTYWIMEIMLKDMRELGISFNQNIYEQYLESILTGCKRLMFMDKDVRRATLSLYSQMLRGTWKGYSTSNTRLKAFEKAVRSNRYIIFKLLVLCL